MRLHEYSADHRYLLEQAAKEAGFDDPVAVDMSDFHDPVMEKAKRGPVMPIDGVMVRDWDPDFRKTWPGVYIGMRMYTFHGLKFVVVRYRPHDELNSHGQNFTAIDRKDYARFYRLALEARRDQGEPPVEPVLERNTSEALLSNTVGFLDSDKLKQIKKYGGRPKRGMLLTGPPGNGKTSACRWLRHECLKRQWDFRLVSPDSYRSARNSTSAAEAVKELFTLENRGIVFFDDMDIALRNRETVHEGDDQAVFLTALDGIESVEGVVFVFTTNCKLDLIDPAFRRPGRIDLVLDFPPPVAHLRRQLVERWHPDIRAGLNLDRVVSDTDGHSFAEIEELKNLLLQRYMEADVWDWHWAIRQFAFNRKDLAPENKKRVGFFPEAGRENENALPSRNGIGFQGKQD